MVYRVAPSTGAKARLGVDGDTQRDAHSLGEPRTCCRYIVALQAYLLSFVKKTQPLVDVVGQQTQAESEFDVLWSEGKLDGWEDSQNDPNQTDAGENSGGIWCAACMFF